MEYLENCPVGKMVALELFIAFDHLKRVVFMISFIIIAISFVNISLKSQTYQLMNYCNKLEPSTVKNKIKDLVPIQLGTSYTRVYNLYETINLLHGMMRYGKTIQDFVNCIVTYFDIKRHYKDPNMHNLSYASLHKCQHQLSSEHAFPYKYRNQLSSESCTHLRPHHSEKNERLYIIKSVITYKIFSLPPELKKLEYFAVIAPTTTLYVLFIYGVHEQRHRRCICETDCSTKSVADVNAAKDKQGKGDLFNNENNFLLGVALSPCHAKDKDSEADVQQVVCFVEDLEISSIKNLGPPVQLPPNIQGDTKRESFRLTTFQSFPTSLFVNVSWLANAGFFYTGHDDVVQCFSCLNTVSSQASENPFDPIMHMSRCAFQELRRGCGNVPIDQSLPSFDSGYGSYPSSGFNSTPAGEVLMKADSGFHSQTYQSAQPSNAPVTTPIPPPPHEINQQLAAIHDPSHKQLLQGLTLSRENDRYITFRNWETSSQKPRPRALAKTGFFYLGNLDRTQCFSCGGVLRNWGSNDNPGAQHLRHFSHCDMAQGRSRSNVPDTSFQPQGQSSVLPHLLTEEEQQCFREMFPCLTPANPRMRYMRDRVQTFRNWTFTRVTPNVIAAAGFFSLGVRDRTKCFYCNGGLQNWRFYDDPWKEHAKWYPTCDYLLRCKGPDFVHSVTAMFPDLDRPVLRAMGQDVPPPQRHGLSNGHGAGAPVVSAAATATVNSQTSKTDKMQLLKASLETDIAKTVIGMGYDLSSVKEVNKRRIAEHGQAYQKAVELLEAVMAYDDEVPMDTDEATELKNKQSLKPALHQSNQLSVSSSFHDPLDVLSSLSLDTRDTPIAATEPSTLVPIHLRNGHASPVNSNMNLPSSSSQWNRDSNIENNTRNEPSTAAEASTLVPTQLRNGHASPVNSSMNSARSSSQWNHESNMESEPRDAADASPASGMLSSSLNGGDTTLASTKIKDAGSQHKLESKFEDLLDEQLCKVCLDRNKEVLFFPCNHLCCCMECSVALRNCPMCRTKIEKGMRIYTTN